MNKTDLHLEDIVVGAIFESAYLPVTPRLRDDYRMATGDPTVDALFALALLSAMRDGLDARLRATALACRGLDGWRVLHPVPDGRAVRSHDEIADVIDTGSDRGVLTTQTSIVDDSGLVIAEGSRSLYVSKRHVDPTRSAQKSHLPPSASCGVAALGSLTVTKEQTRAFARLAGEDGGSDRADARPRDTVSDRPVVDEVLPLAAALSLLCQTRTDLATPAALTVRFLRPIQLDERVWLYQSPAGRYELHTVDGYATLVFSTDA